MNKDANSSFFPVGYYNVAAPVFDILSNKYLYYRSRTYAIEQLQLKEGAMVLNLPCGTGQNFEFMQQYMNNTGFIVGVDLSNPMLKQAKNKIEKYDWQNVDLRKACATEIDENWISRVYRNSIRFDAILCDFGLSSFDQWELVLDNLIGLLKPNGVLVILDWYIPNPGLLWKCVKWLHIGQVDLPIIKHMKSRTTDFQSREGFAQNRIFVASGKAKNQV